MKAVAIVLGALGGLIGMLGIVAAMSYFTYYDLGARSEANLNAVYESNVAVMNSYTVKVQEVAQVPDMFRDDLRSVISETFQGRYGADGSKAVFQFIQENNMSLDPIMYRQIQQVMESGRNEFTVEQKKMVDQVRIYRTNLDTLWSGFWLRVAGYPKVDLKKYEVLATTEVRAKFESGTDTVIKLR